jgi:hypothetical protein
MTLLLLNTTLKISVIVSAALITALAVHSQSPAGARPYKVVFDLTTDDPADQTAVLRWLRGPIASAGDRSSLAVFDDPASPSPTSVVRASGRIDRSRGLRAVSVVWMTGVALALAVLGIGLAGCGG